MLRWIMLAVLSVSFVTAQPSPSLLWKARGLEAKENLTKLIVGMTKTKDDTPPIKLAELNLEGAFAMHVLSESTVHKFDDEFDWFHVLLKGEDGSIFSLVYVYTKPTGTLIATRIDQLPENWRVGISRLAPTVLMILTPGPDFEFDMNDPFSARVVE